ETATLRAVAFHTLTVNQSVRPSTHSPRSRSRYRRVCAMRKLVKSFPDSERNSVGVVATKPDRVTVTSPGMVPPGVDGRAGPGHRLRVRRARCPRPAPCPALWTPARHPGLWVAVAPR